LFPIAILLLKPNPAKPEPKIKIVIKEFHATTPRGKDAKERRDEASISLAPLLFCALA
jgi:hypothetical protein